MPSDAIVRGTARSSGMSAGAAGQAL